MSEYEENGLIVHRAGAWYRMLDGVSTFTRASLAALGVGRSPPARIGASYGLVASKPKAADDLGQMATSPGVYAAVMRRAGSISDAPMVVLRDEVKVDPNAEPWAQELLDLLQYPDPLELASRGDPSGLAPVEPGEGLIAQGVADYLMCGVAWIIPTAGDSRRVIGLSRAHPQHMRIVEGGAYVDHVVGGRTTRYPRRGVFCIRRPSHQSTGQGELGTGAAEPLRSLVAAEVAAMTKTAAIIDQGGADVIVTSTTPQGLAFLSNPANRERVKADVSNALAMRDGSRVIVIAGDLKAESSGLTPSDIQAPELMGSARQVELMTIGVTPAAVGADTANYATAALQYRVQAELDEHVAGAFEAYMLRPLAQHYARVLGRGPADARRVTCRIDLSAHPGYAYARTEAIARMTALIDAGWSPEQAARAEGLPLPKPQGTPRPKTTPAPASPVGEVVKGDGVQRAARASSDPEGD